MSVRTVALLGLAMLVTAAPAQAATFTVTTTADTAGASGCTATLCTVRTAIAAAAANGNGADDVIVLSGATYAVNAASGALTVPTGATRITIQGTGANATAIQSPGTIRALIVNSSAAVTVTGLTLRGGTITSGQGGNVLVSSQASATFNRVRITGGSAPQGGGLAALGAGSLTIQSSLIDGNTATGTALTATGGGIYVQGQTTATPITIQDSTIASNSARNGGGIAIENNTGQAPVLRGVTLARNNARAGTPSGGAGGIYSAATNARFQGSIVAGNTSTFNFGSGPQDLPSNCALASTATDDGGNVTPDTADQCGLGGVHTDPQLAAGLDASQPPALSIPSNSAAVDIAACAPRTVDQRGVTRPQGTTCDAGAYEVDQAPTVTITSGPTGTVASATASFGFSTTEPGVSLQCRMTGPGQSGAFAACTSPTAQSYAGLGSGAYTFSVRALDGTFTNPPIASRAFTVDLTAPDTTLTPIASPTNNTTPTFTFTSEAGATFECSLDSARFTTCNSPLTVATPGQGSHTFAVRATDALGNTDQSPASQAFVIDTTAPNTTLTPITSPTNDATPTFTFTSEAGATFQCSVDGGAFNGCGSPFTTPTLGQGTRTFAVRAIDAAGNVDASPDSQTFTVDTAAPGAPAITTPADNALLQTSTVRFDGTAEAGATVRINEGANVRGTSVASATNAWTITVSTVPDGTHTYAVTATDAAGNASATTTRTVRVDTGAPDTTITGGPSGVTNDATPTFTFVSNEPGSTFQCRIDAAAFANCTSPSTALALADGGHTFEVRAIDVAGNSDAAPASRAFAVDTTPPAAPAVLSGPEGATTDSAPAFGFSAPDAASTACKLDGPGGAIGVFGPCTSPATFSGLAPGDYVFSVRSLDAAGNAETTQRAFTVTVVQQGPQTHVPDIGPPVTPPPPPVANQSVDIKPVSGTVLVKLPGAKVFVKLNPSLIKNGAEVDARSGVVEITRSDGDHARFYDGIFKLSHSGGFTVLTLTEKLTGCPKARKSSASAAAKKPKTRKLWGDGKGKFRTKGQYSAATIRGTRWLVTDTCTTTVTNVAQGVVEVQDFAKKKRVLVKAKKSYTARPKKK